jgi:hypothetical protein
MRVAAEWRRIDDDNTQWLGELIGARGWPGRTLAGEDGAGAAWLLDRVRVNAGQPQLYGTQFTVTDGHFGPCPIEDPHRLDERRAAAGLEPFADYEARMRGRS